MIKIIAILLLVPSITLAGEAKSAKEASEFWGEYKRMLEAPIELFEVERDTPNDVIQRGIEKRLKEDRIETEKEVIQEAGPDTPDALYVERCFKNRTGDQECYSIKQEKEGNVIIQQQMIQVEPTFNLIPMPKPSR